MSVTVIKPTKYTGIDLVGQKSRKTNWEMQWSLVDENGNIQDFNYKPLNEDIETFCEAVRGYN